MRAGNVSSVHLHPETARLPMQLVPSIEAVTGKGILGCTRYFERQTRRQVTLPARMRFDYGKSGRDAMPLPREGPAI